jgi:hypothetical protein
LHGLIVGVVAVEARDHANVAGFGGFGEVAEEVVGAEELAAVMIGDFGGVEGENTARVEEERVELERGPIVEPLRDVEAFGVELIEVDLAAAAHLLIPCRRGTRSLRGCEDGQCAGSEKLTTGERHDPASL